MKRLAVTILLSVAFSPGLAKAGDVGCVWRAIPDGAREAALRAYADGRADDVIRFIDNDMFVQAMAKCVPPSKNDRTAQKTAEAVANALMSYIIQSASEQNLGKRLKIEPTALERAYGLLEPRMRRDLASLADLSKKPGEASSKALGIAIRLAYPNGDYDALIDDPAFRDFVAYFSARSSREQNEAKF